LPYNENLWKILMWIGGEVSKKSPAGL